MSVEDDRLASTEVALIDSVAKAEIKGLVADLAELTIDSVLDNQLLEAVPVVGTVARFYRFAVTIHDRQFLRKVLSFLKEFEDASKEDRLRFADELAHDAGTRERAGAALALLLDRLDNLDKPQIIGRLYVAALEHRLSLAELRRFCMVVERAYLPDLAALSLLQSGDLVDKLAAPYLHALGLVSLTGEDWGTFNGIGAETWYEVNDLGRQFLAVAFPGVPPPSREPVINPVCVD
ncbi:MAG: hypothetical protein ACREJ5_05730 [Geminicoccaceae bacterium]